MLRTDEIVMLSSVFVWKRYKDSEIKRVDFGGSKVAIKYI